MIEHKDSGPRTESTTNQSALMDRLIHARKANVRGLGAERTRASLPGADRGSLTLEAVIVAPVLLMFLALIIAAGRIMIAGGSIEAAARDAARQASIARDPSTARSNAMSSAQAALRQEGLHCRPQVSVDTSGFSRPIGTPASVLVQVWCTVSLSDLVVVGMPGSHTLSASFRSPIDPFRGR